MLWQGSCNTITEAPLPDVGNAKWKGLTWGMMPLLGGALCACTYHFFYNSSDLDFLVAVQASLTWIGNATCAAAAYRIYKASQQEGAA